MISALVGKAFISVGFSRGEFPGVVRGESNGVSQGESKGVFHGESLGVEPTEEKEDEADLDMVD